MFFMTEAFDIVPVTRNAVQYIQSIFLTQDGYSTSPQTIALNGADGSSYFEGDMTVDGHATVGPVLVWENPVSTNYKWLFDFNGYLSMASCSDISHTCSFGGNFYGPLNNLVVDYVAGRVGIGTATPVYTLDVVGAVNGSSLCIAGDCKTTWPSWGGTSLWSTGWSNSINYTLGNVGVGKTTPNYPLDISGTMSATQVRWNSVCVNGDCRTDRPSWWTVIGWDSIWSTGTSNEAYYNLGNVGIGISTPVSKLDIETSAPEIIKIKNTTANTARWFAVSSAVNAGRLSIYSVDGATDPERLSIAYTNGNVGIGTNGNATEKLEVNGNIRLNDTLIFSEAGSTNKTIAPENSNDNDGSNLTIHAWHSNDLSWGPFEWWDLNLYAWDSDSAAVWWNWWIVNIQWWHADDGWPVSGWNVYINWWYGWIIGNVLLANLRWKVGIGTNSPIRPLHVEGNMYVWSDSGNPTDEKILLQDDEYTYAIKNDETWSFILQQRTIGWWFSTDKEIFTINKSGYVGIGTTSPSQPLHVIGEIFSTTQVVAPTIAAQGNLQANGNLNVGANTRWTCHTVTKCDDEFSACLTQCSDGEFQAWVTTNGWRVVSLKCCKL